MIENQRSLRYDATARRAARARSRRAVLVASGGSDGWPLRSPPRPLGLKAVGWRG
jgi:hypothetical protein